MIAWAPLLNIELRRLLPISCIASSIRDIGYSDREQEGTRGQGIPGQRVHGSSRPRFSAGCRSATPRRVTISDTEARAGYGRSCVQSNSHLVGNSRQRRGRKNWDRGREIKIYREAGISGNFFRNARIDRNDYRPRMAHSGRRALPECAAASTRWHRGSPKSEALSPAVCAACGPTLAPAKTEDAKKL
jgi:hypothetical protein